MRQGEGQDLRARDGAERSDVTAVAARLDPKTQKALRGNRILKRCVAGLGAIEGEVVALAPASLARVTGLDGAGIGEVTEASRIRLLALTTDGFWLIETRRALGGGGVVGREIKFARIQDDVRTDEHRRRSEFGRKSRLLAFDHLRGSQLETETFDLGRDELLHDFANRFNAQLGTFRAAQVEQSPRQEPGPAAAQEPGPGGSSASVADELAKLGELLEKGLLTEQEFAREKQRVLER